MKTTVTTYRLKLKGRLSSRWIDWFQGFDLSFEDGNTLLSGPVVDQSALHGLLARIRDLNLTLLSVESMPSEKDNGSWKEK